MRAHRSPSTTTTDPADPGDEPVVVTRRQLDALLELASRVERLEAGQAVPARSTPIASAAPEGRSGGGSGDPAPSGDTAEPGSVRVGRRRALAGLAGAAAAGTVAALAPSSPVAAADGDPVLLGEANAATSPTGITVTGGPTTYGLGIVDGSVSDAPTGGALFAHAAGAQFGTAVEAYAEGTADAVHGRANNGIGGFFTTLSGEQPALLAAGFGIGISAAGVLAQVEMTPESSSPLTFPLPGRTGRLYVQAGQDEESFVDGTFWACVDDGTPGTWRKLAGHDTAGALHILPAPRRVYDSRPGGVPTAVGPKTPLPAGNVARTLDLKAAGSGVPAGATGALVTVLLVNATAGAGNFTVWANDQPKPTSNTLVWGGDAGRFSTLAMTALDPLARVKVDASLQTHLVLDVVGYYR